ncbi:MAG: ketol-acid reductoisomerase [Gammaproteobacteria bacterium]|nr:ketol-acid reductoisomerase [Gammaproteobacteria bacterium]MDH3767834.1 ketol-acid reductoisomerase [Gammaproteobacteria bacterium]
MKLYVEDDVKSSTLEGARIAVLGYGSQGRAHALNLKDSGHNVVVGLRPDGESWAKAQADGLDVAAPEAAAKDADLIAFLVPDMAQAAVYEQVRDQIKPGAALLFAHGFNIHYGQIAAPAELDVILVAPKGPGDLVRRQYEQDRGVPCLFAIEKDASGQARDRALEYAHGIGGTRAGVLETTFAEETETDLFGEQAVLCGGATELVLQGFDTLTEAGYQPEVAYFECMHELKLIVDLLYEGGLAKMHEFVSETAKYGDLTRGPRVIDDHTRERMREVLGEIRDGTFAREWIQENADGRKEYQRLMDKDLAHPVEKVGRQLRECMSWLKAKRARAA